MRAAANFYNIIQHSFAGTGMAQSGYFHRPRKDYQACADKLDALIGLPLYCCDFDFVDFMKARDSKADPDKSPGVCGPPIRQNRKQTMGASAAWALITPSCASSWSGTNTGY